MQLSATSSAKPDPNARGHPLHVEESKASLSIVLQPFRSPPTWATRPISTSPRQSGVEGVVRVVDRHPVAVVLHSRARPVGVEAAVAASAAVVGRAGLEHALASLPLLGSEAPDVAQIHHDSPLQVREASHLVSGKLSRLPSFRDALQCGLEVRPCRVVVADAISRQPTAVQGLTAIWVHRQCDLADLGNTGVLPHLDHAGSKVGADGQLQLELHLSDLLLCAVQVQRHEAVIVQPSGFFEAALRVKFVRAILQVHRPSQLVLPAHVLDVLCACAQPLLRLRPRHELLLKLLWLCAAYDVFVLVDSLDHAVWAQ
mmetsp:Transcript_90255/g.229512  ORF Transcript_90255/g.229512 Transcript_90255/m.229512 type:complete len:314 (-) Transcript_90255:189-1130(-)